MNQDKRTEWCSDILTTAIEGGINYWAKGRQFKQAENGFCTSCEIKPSGDEGEPFPEGDIRNGWQVLDSAAIEVAVLRIIAGDLCRKDIKETVILDWQDPDAFRSDAETADVIVQVALFGEIVFG